MSTRVVNFTEAVPLSLSSMAHMTMPLEEGVLDGVKQVLQHTLLSCVNYARAMYAPHHWTFRDLTTTPHAWKAHYQSSSSSSSNSTTMTAAAAAAAEGDTAETSGEDQGGKRGGGGGEETANRSSIRNNAPTKSTSIVDGSSSSSTAAAGAVDDIKSEFPTSLTRLGFKFKYHRTAFIYLKAALDPAYGAGAGAGTGDDNNDTNTKSNGNNNNNNKTATASKKDECVVREEQEVDWYLNDNWTQQKGVLGRISLLYATTALMTQEELDGTEPEDEETPKCVLYKVVVEYRSLPATGNKAAVQAEELSMLSFGGSVDDDVKYGALAALYDPLAKYVLEIYSVRGKKYKFDLMDATLSNGTVPRLPTRGGGQSSSTGSTGTGSSCPPMNDPFVKSLCVTVTDHVALQQRHNKQQQQQQDEKEKQTEDGDDSTKAAKVEADAAAAAAALMQQRMSSITRINLTMEGNLRTKISVDNGMSNHSGKSGVGDDKNNGMPPKPYFVSNAIQEAFLALNSNPPPMATAPACGHSLLLDPQSAGKVYIDGRYVTTWGEDPKIGSHFPALFGMNIHSVPNLHGRILDYDIFKYNYSQLWQEILIDARLKRLDVGGKLLSRLICGKDPIIEKDDDDDDDDDDDMDDDDMDDEDDDDDDDDEDDEEESESKKNADSNSNNNSSRRSSVMSKRASKPPPPPRPNTKLDCLEQHVMQSGKYDPVGISAKALATTFLHVYGEVAFPCMHHEIDWVKDRLPGRNPISVPSRLISILRRGGYFDTKRSSDDIWFTESRPAKEIEEDGEPKKTGEEKFIQATVELLRAAKCTDVQEHNIVFFSGEGVDYAVEKKGLVRFNRTLRQYHVNVRFLTMDLDQIMGNNNNDDDRRTNSEDDEIEGEGAVSDIPDRAYLLGLHIAREHPDGTTLIRYALTHHHKDRKDNVNNNDDNEQQQQLASSSSSANKRDGTNGQTTTDGNEPKAKKARKNS